MIAGAGTSMEYCFDSISTSELSYEPGGGRVSPDKLARHGVAARASLQMHREAADRLNVTSGGPAGTNNPTRVVGRGRQLLRANGYWELRQAVVLMLAVMPG